MHDIEYPPAKPVRASDRLEMEHRLLRAAQSGDPEAFAALFRHFRPRIFRLARSYYAPGAEYDDLIQEATIGFFKAIRDFEGDRGALGAFVELCVRRQIITFVKISTRLKHAPLNRAASLDAPPFTDSDEALLARLAAPDITSAKLNTDNTEFLNALWERCSALERGVLSMYSKGYEFREMAIQLGVHCKAIKNAVWRVKEKARKVLAETPLNLS